MHVAARNLVLALVAISPLHVAAQPPGHPWGSNGHAKQCLDSQRAREPLCELLNWPSFYDTSNRVFALFRDGEFDLLDRAMMAAANSDRRFEDGGTPAEAVYSTFRLMFQNPSRNPLNRQKLDAWAAATPKSIFLRFVQARYAYASGWEVRGTDYSAGVSQESWELFRIRLEEAEQLLLGASVELKETPYWHQLLMAVSGDMARPTYPVPVLFDEAIKRWPRYFAFYELRLRRMVPRWGGNWRQVDDAIRQWGDRLAVSEGKSLYARLYVSLLRSELARDFAMDWQTMRASFEDLIVRYPTREFMNYYASFACFARDKEAFASVYGKIARGQISPELWLPGYSHEACLRWAGV